MRGALKSLLVALVVSAIGLSACGRKGPLEAPPKAKTASAQSPAGDPPGRSSRPFILDRLLR